MRRQHCAHDAPSFPPNAWASGPRRVARQPVFSFRNDLGNRHQPIRLGVRVHALADWASAAAEGLQRYAGRPLRGLFRTGPESPPPLAQRSSAEIAIWSLRSLRRGRQLEKSLAEATFDRDAKTHWFTLEIVMRNLQRHALLVRSVEIIDPPGTKICDRWQAWRPETASVKFVAPELDLTDSASIETTIFPYNTNDYADQAE